MPEDLSLKKISDGPFQMMIGKETLGAYLAIPKSGRGPGVMVLHSWWGLTPFYGALCERLAARGFVAMAPDFYNGATAQTAIEARRLRDTLDDRATSRLLVAAAKHLQAHPETGDLPMATLGVSLGCRWALALAEAMPEDVAAAVVFYGLQRGRYRRSRAAFLGHFGMTDPLTPLKEIRALEAALKNIGCDVSFEIYDHVGHSFFETDRPEAYDPGAATLAWNRTLRFLHEKLDVPPTPKKPSRRKPAPG